jgi:hypothetical protein
VAPTAGRARRVASLVSGLGFPGLQPGGGGSGGGGSSSSTPAPPGIVPVHVMGLIAAVPAALAALVPFDPPPPPPPPAAAGGARLRRSGRGRGRTVVVVGCSLAPGDSAGPAAVWAGLDWACAAAGARPDGVARAEVVVPGGEEAVWRAALAGGPWPSAPDSSLCLAAAAAANAPTRPPPAPAVYPAGSNAPSPQQQSEATAGAGQPGPARADAAGGRRAETYTPSDPRGQPAQPAAGPAEHSRLPHPPGPTAHEQRNGAAGQRPPSLRPFGSDPAGDWSVRDDSDSTAAAEGAAVAAVEHTLLWRRLRAGQSRLGQGRPCLVCPGGRGPIGGPSRRPAQERPALLAAAAAARGLAPPPPAGAGGVRQAGPESDTVLRNYATEVLLLADATVRDASRRRSRRRQLSESDGQVIPVLSPSPSPGPGPPPGPGQGSGNPVVRVGGAGAGAGRAANLCQDAEGDSAPGVELRVGGGDEDDSDDSEDGAAAGEPLLMHPSPGSLAPAAGRLYFDNF